MGNGDTKQLKKGTNILKKFGKDKTDQAKKFWTVNLTQTYYTGSSHKLQICINVNALRHTKESIKE